MPIYEYEHDAATECPSGERFEVIEGLSAAPLAVCPACGVAVHRCFSAPRVQGAGRSADTLSNKNLAAKGFTKYVKAGDGHYEKAAGKGPDVIKR